MAARTTPSPVNEAQLRAEIEARRAGFQQRLARDRRLLVACASLVVSLGGFAILALAGALGG